MRLVCRPWPGVVVSALCTLWNRRRCDAILFAMLYTSESVSLFWEVLRLAIHGPVRTRLSDDRSVYLYPIKMVDIANDSTSDVKSCATDFRPGNVLYAFATESARAGS